MSRMPIMILRASRFLGVLASLFSLTIVTCNAREHATNDRWLEIDLYWFDDNNVQSSADRFWDRYEPLFENVEGYRGVVLNVGMTVNYVMEYSDLDQAIALPKGHGQELGARINGQLAGSTPERQAEWRTRYREPDNSRAQSGYGDWSYGELKKLASALRSTGAKRGISDFRVGSLIVGMDGAYGEMAPFARDHPEAWSRWPLDAAGALASSSNFDPSVRLRADPRPRGGLPRGILASMPVHAAFAAQWGALSRDIGLDALMLRDSMSFPRAYTRYGPYGETVPDAGTAERMTSGLAALIRESKKANPGALIMMYSTGATATADWRANGIDLERIADEGYLDIFVDQTWAGAWNEVGVRQQTFWNAPILGWTYQLSYMMQHAAVLAKSKVRQYFLTDTFDAWESWDTIHTAPERLRWAIWAFSHVTVKTPVGLRVPAGSYISWGNRGDALLEPADVAFIASELDAAGKDAAAMTDIYGPTLVYSRDVAAAQLENGAPRGDLRDRIDEQLGSMIKWPVPIMSITRLEWLDKVSSPLFLFGSTRSLPKPDRDHIVARARRGQPMAFIGGFAASTHPDFLRLANASATDHRPSVQDRRLDATLGTATASLPLKNFPISFAAPPTLAHNSADETDVLYGFAFSPALVRHQAPALDVVAWDPPPLADYWFRPLIDNMNGSPAPYALATAALTAQLAAVDTIRAREIDLRETGSFAAWRDREGRVRILAGNLEEGLRDDSDRSRTIEIALPSHWRQLQWRHLWMKDKPLPAGASVTVKLAPQGSALLVSDRRATR